MPATKPEGEHLFLRACRRQPVERTPIWMMRQAGRYLPQYRAVREKVSFLELCKTPDIACEVTLQPIDEFGFDAAILFADILLPLEAMGLELEFRPAPMIANPARDRAAIDRLSVPDPEAELPYVMGAVRAIRKALDGRVPLIGFAGAPFTMATYAVEGSGSKSWIHTKSLMFADPEAFHALLDKLARSCASYLAAQVAAGAQAVQLFDSWVGALSPADYRAHVLPASAKVLGGLADLDVPRIHFAVGAGELLEPLAEAGADVMGIDWRMPLSTARRRLGSGAVLQGNLDPFVVQVAPWDVVAECTVEVLRDNGGHPGHVFNLGWGVQPQTDPDVLHRVVDLVHATGPLTG
jgi:uroporphyrinogen decarboxylase